VIKKILKHLGLWEVKARPLPKVKAPSVTIYLDDSESQVLSPDSFYVHSDYPMDSNGISKPHRSDFTGYNLCYESFVSDTSRKARI